MIFFLEIPCFFPFFYFRFFFCPFFYFRIFACTVVLCRSMYQLVLSLLSLMAESDVLAAVKA